MIKSILLASAALIALAATPANAQDTSAAGPDIDLLVDAETAGDASMNGTADAEGIVTTARDYWGNWGIDTSLMNPAVKPGDDFYAYVNGKWLDNFEMPADRTRYGAFTLLAEKSEQRVRKIIDELAATQPDPMTGAGKVAAFYNAYLDTAAIDAAGLAPAQPYLDKIKAAKTREDLAKLFGAPGFRSPVAGFVDIDSKQTDKYIFQVTQAGLGLPDRDYYLVDSEANLKIREGYMTYLTFLMGKAGYADPAATAQQVYDLEKAMAAEHWDRAVGRNRNLTYNKLSKAEMVALGGGFPVEAFMQTIGVDGQQEFVVRQLAPTAEELAAEKLTPEQAAKLGSGIPGLFKLANTAPIATWQAWLTAGFLSTNASVLPSDIDEANFAFYGTVLGGQQKQRERWQRGVAAVEGTMGEIVGKIYADRYFPAENKAAMDELVGNLRKAMAANLVEIDWMGEATKVEARDKLAKFTPKIGYTEKFETYDSLAIAPGKALDNVIAATTWGYKDNISKLGKPIDKTEWFMLPQTVNAYYSPPRNEIVFPAAILQPPFFNLSADPAVNYGAIGGVIGHEMGHGFDDQGSKSDGDGVLRDWWTPEDQANFKKLTTALVAQYSALCPLDDGKTCVNGALTLGENIGDVGGLSMAYRAYKIHLDGKEDKVIDGMTGDQRFFMAWAQVWRNKSREEYLRQQLQTDSHSPPNYRANGTVRNFNEWYQAFDVKPGDALYLPPEKRIRIW
ncbi:M13 family metallopeptidase [Blastomonas aquatica]|uniref:Peptidase M13 n=1 Tax=Blastomonas aquatica TaxID=1510276 RepID=A0ABQ1J467_9SPHN|nr:M13 family metallopeptidase [Blastomonas aquatica]GGB57605.1 peptidase M13 [Blastomonas aquatica]